MAIKLAPRPARSPLSEGLSIVPYLLLYQRLHRRRWAAALVLSAGLAILALGAARRR